MRILSISSLMVSLFLLTSIPSIAADVRFWGEVTYESPFEFNKYDIILIHDDFGDTLGITHMTQAPPHQYSKWFNVSGGARWFNLKPRTGGGKWGCPERVYWNGTDPAMIEEDLVFKLNCASP